MAGMKEEAQWIIMMGFIISIGIFFLAILINQSMLVGQTTAESVMEFPKSDIQDLRSEVHVLNIRYNKTGGETSLSKCIEDISTIAISNKSAIVRIYTAPSWKIHYYNGVTNYSETIQWWEY